MKFAATEEIRTKQQPNGCYRVNYEGKIVMAFVVDGITLRLESNAKSRYKDTWKPIREGFFSKEVLVDSVTFFNN